MAPAACSSRSTAAPAADAVADNMLLLDYLREIVGLTGTKTGCDGGECGACTVLVDDQPRLSCLTLAATRRRPARRHGRVAGDATAGCRRCSAASTKSSARNAAIARRASSWPRPACCGAIRSPTEDEIREALGSNICRCTGYVKIIEAVKYAAELHAARSRRHERDRAGRITSAATCRWSTGRRRCPAAPNTPPILSRRACSPGASIRSPYSHAEILDVDVSEAAKLPGVKAIVTGADCDKTFGVLPIARTEHPLARDKVRYRGEPVAAVAADRRRDRARRRSRRIKLKVRELPAYYTRAGRDGAGRRRSCTSKKPGNLERDVLFELGDVDAGLCRRRSGARGHLQLRRGLPEPDGDARRGRRLRRGARPHDRACLDAGAVLRAPDAVADPRHGHVAHPRDQAACRRRLRLPHRDAQRRADRRAARAQGRRLRAHRDQPRGDLHHPSRPAGDRHPAQDRHAQGRPHHRGRMRVHPARRRAFRLRRGDHPLCRLDAVRDLRPAQRQICRQARADQHAAVRRLPRPRHGRRALRLREPARRDGGRARARSVRRAPRQSAAARRPSPTTT